jgi:5'-3' exonuclease
MGIPGLNRFLLKKCSNKAIRNISLYELQNKKIVIDIHNYLYDFINTDNFSQSLREMVQNFQKNNINPIFIYDGKSPPEKKETLQLRNEKKNQNQKLYEELLEKMPTTPDTIALLQSYKAGSIRLRHTHLEESKQLLELLQVEYYVSEYESDPICVEMVNSGKVWACMSQDMDMFLYGCKRVLRKHDSGYYLYDFEQIIRELKMTVDSFRELFVLLGTDYCQTSSQKGKQSYMNINVLYRFYCQFYQSKSSHFLEWFHWCYPQYLNDDEYHDALRVCAIFEKLPKMIEA